MFYSELGSSSRKDLCEIPLEEAVRTAKVYDENLLKKLSIYSVHLIMSVLIFSPRYFKYPKGRT